MRVRVQQMGSGLAPHEVVVELITACGPQRMCIDRKAVEKGSVAVGLPLRRDDQFVLVGLPRETLGGSWRVWVPADDVLVG